MKKNLASVSMIAFALALGACGGDKTQTEIPNDPPENHAGAQDEADGSAASNGASNRASNDIVVSAAELEGNPFVATWETPYGTPPFSKIKDEHYMPAIKAAILDLRAEIDAIVNTDDPATFENTIVALDLVGKQMSKVSGTFSNITNTDTNDTLRALESKIYPMLTREYNAIQFNEDLFERVKSVYKLKDTLSLDEQDARLLELTHRDFVRAGAALDRATKDRVAQINEEISGLTTTFGQNLLKATTSFKLEITDPADLGGLTNSFKSAIKVDGENKWVISLNRSPYETFLTQSTNRDLRKKTV